VGIHDFFLRHSRSNKDVDPRDKPGGEDFLTLGCDRIPL
jgi:hypothetical protein